MLKKKISLPKVDLKLTIGKKILLGFVFVTAIGVSANLFTKVFTQEIVNSSHEIAHNSLPHLQGAMTIETIANEQKLMVSEYIKTTKVDSKLEEEIRHKSRVIAYMVNRVV